MEFLDNSGRYVQVSGRVRVQGGLEKTEAMELGHSFFAFPGNILNNNFYLLKSEPHKNNSLCINILLVCGMVTVACDG